uniref:Phosphatidylinositol-4-phosphate 5-Kinase, putative n=1 Tax=Theileria annulata TaxID=5874 RepID=A0A3B0N3R4_THEAN
MDSTNYLRINLIDTGIKSKSLMRIKNVKLLKRHNFYILNFKDKFKKLHKKVIKTSKTNTYNNDVNNNTAIKNSNGEFMSLHNERSLKNKLDVFEGIKCENIVKIIKIYLKNCLLKDCKLVNVSKNYIEDIVDLVFNPCIIAKSEPILNKFNVKRKDKLFLFKGFCFYGHTTHFPNNILKQNKQYYKVLLLKNFIYLENDINLSGYESISNLTNLFMNNKLNKLAEKICDYGINIIIAENYIPYHISTLLSGYKVICISNVGNVMINKLSYALKCNVLDSIISSIPDFCESLDKNSTGIVSKNQANMSMGDLSIYMGICEECNIIENKKSMVCMRFLDYFKGFTVLISTRLMSSEILKTVKELIKITLIRLQTIIEELQFINNLNGTVPINRNLINTLEDNRQVCENFSDYILNTVTGDEKSVNVNDVDSDIIYYGNMNSIGVLRCSTVSSVEYRKIVKLTLYKYYTNNNQTCSGPERVNVPVGNFVEGNFLVDFLKNLLNCLKINKCLNLNCSEPFLNHQLHFETSYSNTPNMKLTLTFQHTTHNFTTLDNFTEEDPYNNGLDSEINMDIYCMKCNSSKRYKTRNITFGKFIQLLMLNKLYKSDCGHLLFCDHKFIVLIEHFTITFHLTNVTVFNILPQFDTKLYNSQINTLNPIQVVCTRNEVPNDDGIGIYFPVNNSITSIILRNECNKIYHWLKRNYKNLLNGDVIEQIPCICSFSPGKSIKKDDSIPRSQWVKEIKGLDFTTFLIKYEKHSSLNIELNPKIRDKIKQTLNKGVTLYTCEECGMELYNTISDIEILNWIYIIIGITKELMRKIVKVKIGVNYVKQFFNEFYQFYASLCEFENKFLNLFVQICTHILYAKYHCPRDPIQVFTIIKSFYITYYRLFEELLYNYRKISHIDHVSNFKLKEDEDVIIQYVSGESKKYVKINQGTIYGVNELEEDNLSDLEEYLVFLREFAVLSGIQDLSSEPIKKTIYIKLINKIKLNSDIEGDPIVCLDYKPIIQPKRDIASILSKALVKTMNTEINHYFASYFTGVESENIVNKVGLCANYVMMNRIKMGEFSGIFGINDCKFTKNKYKSRFLKPIFDINDMDLSKLCDSTVKSIGELMSGGKRRIKRLKTSNNIPYYGIPIIYTSLIETSKETKDGPVDSISKVEPKCVNYFLYEMFNELYNVSELKVNVRLLLNKSLNSIFEAIKNNCLLKFDANSLVAFGEVDFSHHVELYNGEVIEDLVKVNMDEEVNRELEASIEKEVNVGPYNVIIYYMNEFRRIRLKYCGDEMNFIRSLSRSTRMFSIGKSGSPIFMTHDGKFTIKLINKHEIGLFITRGSDFFWHFNNNKTLMSLPYGLFKVTHVKTNTSINCFVMQNIDYFNDVKVSFDLKGVFLKRFISIQNTSSNGITTNTNGVINGYGVGNIEVLLDQNFKIYTKGCPIQLNEESINIINNILKNDLEFLSSINIVDYSLLLRILPTLSIITIGLIDFLRPYTWDKQIETVGKRLANIGQAPTIVSPNEYKTRFFNFIQKTFIHFPKLKYNNAKVNTIGDVIYNDTNAVKDNTHNLVKGLLVEYEHRIIKYKSCKVCRIMKCLYDNPYYSCLKFYMAMLSPNVLQYLHSVYSSKGTKIYDIENKNEDGEDNLKSGVEELVKLIQNIHQTPTINWTII